MDEKKLNIVLAGQANVGKSVIFNNLTGLHQHIGNWPGKTVEKAEGTLHYKGYTIDILDLPGIYSLTTYSMEEIISREHIVLQKPDFVVNVVDGTNLERNLIFSLQILELENPTVLALNFVNLFKEKGIEVDYKKLEEILGVPVVPVVAIHKKGITKVLDRGIELISSKTRPKPLRYGQQIEAEIKRITEFIGGIDLPYPTRWLAVKLLERDKEIEKLFEKERPKILEKAKESILRFKKNQGCDSAIIIAGERCHLVSEIVKKVTKITKPSKLSTNEKIDLLTLHKIWGYPVMSAIFALMFLTIFTFGNWFSSVLEGITAGWKMQWENIFGVSTLASFGWVAVKSGISLIEIALPYITPFYLILYLLEDWGYLARVAFLMDNLMHKIGIHGKSCIPLMLGFGCNVPACLSCRIMETDRERFLTGFLTTLVPCSARTVIIMGLVGKFVGINWAFGFYLFAILIIFGLGKLATIVLPGEATELIMEIPDYRTPHLRTVFLQTWSRLKEFLYIATPLVIISGIIIEGIYLAGWLGPIANFLSPITVKWLGLPVISGIVLIFGILRKELILVMLATLLGTANFSQVLTPVQMITLALVSMLYIPCVATIAVLWREFGWQKALGVTIFEVFFAIFVGGIAFRLLSLFL